MVKNVGGDDGGDDGRTGVRGPARHGLGSAGGALAAVAEAGAGGGCHAETGMPVHGSCRGLLCHIGLHHAFPLHHHHHLLLPTGSWCFPVSFFVSFTWA